MKRYPYPSPTYSHEHHAYMLWQVDQFPPLLGSTDTLAIARREYRLACAEAGRAFKDATGMNAKESIEYEKAATALDAFYVKFPNENTEEGRIRARETLKAYDK